MLSVGELVHACAGIIGGGNPEAEAREIVSSVLDVNRSWPAVHSGEIVAADPAEAAVAASRRRANGMPVQYAVGKAAFRHLQVDVDSRVLIPRPETEVLVSLVLKTVCAGKIADIGTGSGAIAISLATEGSYGSVIATDVSAAALEVARANAHAYQADLHCPLEFREGSFLAPLAAEQFDAIVSNPPYIAEHEMNSLPPEVRDWEPHLALVSGEDGLDAIREIVSSAPARLKAGGLLALEVDTRRTEKTADIFRSVGEFVGIEVSADLTGRPRFVTGIRRDTERQREI